jgi:hypothetical protein
LHWRGLHLRGGRQYRQEGIWEPVWYSRTAGAVRQQLIQGGREWVLLWLVVGLLFVVVYF